MHQVGDLRRRGAFTGRGLSPRTRLLPSVPSVPPAPRLGSWVRSSGESLTGVPDCLSVGPWVLGQDSSSSLGFPEGSSASWSGWQRSGDSNCNVLSFPGRLVPLIGVPLIGVPRLQACGRASGSQARPAPFTPVLRGGGGSEPGGRVLRLTWVWTEWQTQGLAPAELAAQCEVECGLGLPPFPPGPP